MSSDTPLLTIAIPTYNRSRYLDRLLHSLAPQLENESRIELLISDNASPDETQSVLEAHSRRGLSFRGIRNTVNIGGDGNIVQCFTEAAGKYVWIIGDDDLVLAGALKIVLQLLDQDEFDIIHLQGVDLIEGRRSPDAPKEPRIQIIDEARVFVRKTHVFLTFITGNIINKARISSLPHQPFSELIGTTLAQLSWVYPLVRNFRKAAFIVDPIFAAGADDRGGYSLFSVFGTNLKRMTDTLLVKPELVRIVMNGTIQSFFPVFVLRSALRQGAFSGESPESILATLFSNNWRYYFFLYPLLKLPHQAARVWFQLIRVINRVNKLLGNPLLG